MNDNEPVIVVASDRNYVVHAAVMLYSLLSNTATRPQIHYIHSDTPVELLHMLEARLSKWSPRIHFHSAESSRIASLPSRGHLSIATYLRLLIPDLLPQEIGKALYLDADMVVLDDIAGLWAFDLGPNAAAMAENCGDPSFVERLGMPRNAFYFNSGVIAINLDYWRRNEVGVKALDFIFENSARLKWMDQDALNLLLQGKCLCLHPRWNVTTRMYEGRTTETCHMTREILGEATANPAIIHYTSHRKPWYPTNRHPRKDAYRYFRQLMEKGTTALPRP